MHMKNLYLSTITSVLLASAMMASAEEGTTPDIKSGFTASVGTFYATSSADNTFYAYDSNLAEQEVSPIQVVPGYDFGVEASIGYIFNHANSLELAYRHFQTSDTSTASGQESPFGDSGDYNSKLSYQLNAFDLMASHFVHLGHMEVRLAGGLAYAQLEQKLYTNFFETKGSFNEAANKKSKFEGFGPRVGVDARYDVGYDIGILGGVSLAYLFGDLDISLHTTEDNNPALTVTANADADNNAVTNIRMNLGADYAYFFGHKKGAMLGAELGFMADHYVDAIGDLNLGQNPYAATFSGPYLNFKAGF